MKHLYVCGFALLAGILMAGNLQAGVGILKADAQVSAASPGTNFGASPLLNVGGGNTSLVQFDLSPSFSALVSGVPTTTTPIIGRAVLTVYVNKALVAGTLSASPLLGAWNEGTVTFSSLPAQGASIGSVAVTAGGQFVEIDVTDAVQGWMNNNNNPASPNYVGGGNFGLSLNSADGTFVLDSKEGTGTSHPAQLDIELPSGSTVTLKKNLTLSAPGFTSLMSIILSGTETAGGRIFYTVRATDGGSQIATEEGVLQYLATANSITCTVQVTDKLHLGTVNSGCTPGFFNPGSHPGVSIFDNVTFSNPVPIVVHEIEYRIETQSGAAIRLEP